MIIAVDFDGTIVDHCFPDIGEPVPGAFQMDPERGLCVKLPGNTKGRIWAMGEPPTDEPTHHWNVSGEPPNVTATPSINMTGTYHGWVTNGVVTEDCEGRKFDDYGKLQE